MTDPAKLTLKVGDASNPDQVGWIGIAHLDGQPANVYAESTGTHIYFNTPATDNVIWTLSYDGSVIASYRLDVVIAPEEVVAAPKLTSIVGSGNASQFDLNSVTTDGEGNFFVTIATAESQITLNNIHYQIENAGDAVITEDVTDDNGFYDGPIVLSKAAEGVYNSGTGCHLNFGVPDNGTYRIYADGQLIGTFRVDIVAAGPVDPIVDYGTITVGPSSIVAGSQSYIQVTYGEALANADFALLGQDGQIIGASVKGVNGKAVIAVTAPSEPGSYTVAALLGGQTVVTGNIEVRAVSSNIWETYYSISSAGTIVINFNEGIATKDNIYNGIVTINGQPVQSQLQGDRSLVTNIAWDSLAAGSTTVFTIKGIIYPRLYPGYAFSFTTTVVKP